MLINKIKALQFAGLFVLVDVATNGGSSVCAISGFHKKKRRIAASP